MKIDYSNIEMSSKFSGEAFKSDGSKVPVYGHRWPGIPRVELVKGPARTVIAEIDWRTFKLIPPFGVLPNG